MDLASFFLLKSENQH